MYRSKKRSRNKKEVVVAAKGKYEAALNELNVLVKKKQDLQGKELVNAFLNNDKSLEEILAFMGAKNEDEE